jgi:hypothetical protein
MGFFAPSGLRMTGVPWGGPQRQMRVRASRAPTLERRQTARYRKTGRGKMPLPPPRTWTPHPSLSQGEREPVSSPQPCHGWRGCETGGGKPRPYNEDDTGLPRSLGRRWSGRGRMPLPQKETSRPHPALFSTLDQGGNCPLPSPGQGPNERLTKPFPWGILGPTCNPGTWFSSIGPVRKEPRGWPRRRRQRRRRS